MNYNQYVIDISGANAMGRKNCQILINLDYPQGWSFSIIRMDYRGNYDISAGATATQSALFYYQGSVVQTLLSTQFIGPTKGSYILSDIPNPNSILWSPCGANVALGVNTSLVGRVNAASSSGYIHFSTDSIDGNIQTNYALQWRKCE